MNKLALAIIAHDDEMWKLAVEGPAKAKLLADVEATPDGQFILVHPTAGDLLYDSLDDMIEDYPQYAPVRAHFHGE